MTPTMITADLLSRVAERASALGYDDPGFATMLRDAASIVGGLDEYVGRMTSEESSDLADLAARTRARNWKDEGSTLEAEMLSGHVEGRLLSFLARAVGAGRILEIGLFTGYSALALAEALPPDGIVVACEIDPLAVELARDNLARSSAGAKVRIEPGPAATTLEKLEAAGERFDLVFIDADKAGYRGYVDALLDGRLLSPGALICIDNTLMQGQPWRGGELTANGRAIAAFNEWLAVDPRVEQVVLPIRDGLTLVRRRVVGADFASASNA